MGRRNVLDPIDLRIVSLLQREPELTISGLAERVGLSQTPCWRRLKRLQEDGIITRGGWLLDAALVGLSVHVFAEVKLKNHDEDTLEAFERMTIGRAEIVECFSMSGDSDYLLRIIVGSVSDYETFLKKILLHLPGIASINSRFALNALKITTVLPI